VGYRVTPYQEGRCKMEKRKGGDAVGNEQREEGGGVDGFVDKGASTLEKACRQMGKAFYRQPGGKYAKVGGLPALPSALYFVRWSLYWIATDQQRRILARPKSTEASLTKYPRRRRVFCHRQRRRQQPVDCPIPLHPGSQPLLCWWKRQNVNGVC